MDSAQSEDNLDSKVAGSNPSLNVMANGSRAYSSEDLRSMGAPMSGPSGLADPPQDCTKPLHRGLYISDVALVLQILPYIQISSTGVL